MRTTIHRAITKRCPFRDETDLGELTIVFGGAAPELHALGEAVLRLGTAPVSHEHYTGQVASLLPPTAQVTTQWQTGGWDVEVTASGTDTSDDLPCQPVDPEGA